MSDKNDWIPKIKAELADVPWASETKLALIAQKIRQGNPKYAEGITEAQIMEAIMFAASLQLNPLEGQIAFTARGSRYNDSISLVPIVQIKGMLSIAHRTGEVTGIEPSAIFDGQGQLKGAVVKVGRNGHDYIGKKYGVIQKNGNADYTSTDATINAALRIALRLAFPEFLGSVYDAEDFANGADPVIPAKPVTRENTAIKSAPPNGADKPALTAAQRKQLADEFFVIFDKQMPSVHEMDDDEKQFCQQIAGEIRADDKKKMEKANAKLPA